jgi:hypothetical protein
MNRSVTNGSQ